MQSDEERRFLDLAEAMSGVGRWRIDVAAGAGVWWSPEVYRIHGVDPDRFNPNVDAAIGFYHPDDRDAVAAYVTRAISHQEGFAFQLRLERTDGETRQVVCKAECEVDAQGATRVVLGVFQDITEAVRAVETARAGEARYRLLAEAVSDVVLKVGPDDVIDYVSPSAGRYGWSPEAMVGQKGASFIHPDDLARVLRTVVQVSAGEPIEAARDRTYRLRKADGDYAWVEGNSSTVREADGSVRAVVSNLRDVTERKAVETALAGSEARYRALADSSTDVILRAGFDGVINYVSPACRALGYAEADLVGRNAVELVHPDDVASIEDMIRKLALGDLTDLPQRREYRVLTRDGGTVWMEGNPTVLHDDTGRPAELLSVLRDVSARRAIEDALAEAKAAAEAATVVKSDFLANMSHEIRTPLTAILGFTGLLSARADLSDPARMMVGRIKGAGTALLSIVNDILDFSKLEAGQIEIAPRPVDVVETAREALTMLGPQAEAKGLALEFQAAGDIPAQVSVDPDRLRQILLNLVGNAVKFTEAGTVRLALAYDPTRERLSVRVEDTGAGMDEAQRIRLFQRFSQVDAAATRQNGGTGLGLAICKGLTEAMGGEIGVDSTPGRGSAFHFHIAAPAVASEDLLGTRDVRRTAAR